MHGSDAARPRAIYYLSGTYDPIGLRVHTLTHSFLLLSDTYLLLRLRLRNTRLARVGRDTDEGCRIRTAGTSIYTSRIVEHAHQIYRTVYQQALLSHDPTGSGTFTLGSNGND